MLLGHPCILDCMARGGGGAWGGGGGAGVQRRPNAKKQPRSSGLRGGLGFKV